MEKRGMRYGFVAMLFSMLIALAAFAPSTAFADESNSITVNTAGELTAAIASNDKATIVLGQDIETGITVPAGKEITIDLNGKTLSRAGGQVIDNYGSLLLKNGTISLTNASGASAIWVNGNAKLTINNDVKVTAPDNSFCVSYWSDCTSAEVNLAGTLSGGNGVTVNGMIPEGTLNTLNIDGANINVSGHGVYLAGAASTNIKNSTIKGSTGVEVRAGNLVVDDSEITGGEDFTTQANPGGTTTEGAGIAIAQHTTKQAINVTVNGGTISGNYAIYEGNPQTNSPEDVAKINLSLTDGIFDGSVSAEDVKGFVSGGTFTDASVLKYVKSGNAAMKKSQDGGFTIVPEEQAKSEAAAKIQNGDSVIYFAHTEDAKKYAEDKGIDPSFVEQLRFVITYVDGLTDAAYGPTCTVPAGQKLTKAAINTPDGEELIPAKEGYTFTGWYLDKELTQKVTFPFEPSSDMELYAGFSKNDPAVNPSQDGNKTTTTTTKTSSAKTGDNLALFGGLLALIAAAGATTAAVAVRHRKSE